MWQLAYAAVPREKRKLFRGIVRKHYMANPNDRSKALTAIEVELRSYGSVMFWLTVISILVQVARLAMDYWYKNNVSEPPVVEIRGEPFGTLAA